jgi:hypothetical protein
LLVTGRLSQAETESRERRALVERALSELIAEWIVEVSGAERMTNQDTVIYKTRDNNNNDLDGSGDSPAFSDEQLDVLASTLAATREELRAEWQAAIDSALADFGDEQDLREAIAELRGQLAAVMNLFGSGNGLKLEETVRQLRMITGEGGA